MLKKTWFQGQGQNRAEPNKVFRVLVVQRINSTTNKDFSLEDHVFSSKSPGLVRWVTRAITSTLQTMSNNVEGQIINTHRSFFYFFFFVNLSELWIKKDWHGQLLRGQWVCITLWKSKWKCPTVCVCVCVCVRVCVCCVRSLGHIRTWKKRCVSFRESVRLTIHWRGLHPQCGDLHMVWKLEPK